MLSDPHAFPDPVSPYPCPYRSLASSHPDALTVADYLRVCTQAADRAGVR